MPDCHEWDVAGTVRFQVLDNPRGDCTTVTLRVADLPVERDRLEAVGIDVPEPAKVEGFDTLRFAKFEDPEGNTVGLLDGS